MLDRRYLPELEKLYRENKFKNLTVVINGVEMESKKYGYAAMVMDTVTAMEWNMEERKNVMSSIKLLIE